LTRDLSWESTLHSEPDQTAKSTYGVTADADRKVVEGVAEMAEKHGTSRTHIALVWLLQKEPVTAPLLARQRSCFWKKRLALYP
jgi:aryl-alcohol dehydrogenase-like predicted oxidoreductase